MVEKIKLFMDLKSLKFCKNKNDVDVCQRLIYLYYKGRYDLPGCLRLHGRFVYRLDKRLALAKDELARFGVSREECVENFKSKFNEHVQLVFVGKTEEGRKLFNELENFLHQPEPDLWR